MSDKAALRKLFKEQRKAYDPALRETNSQRIVDRLVESEEYKICETLLCFVSAKYEPNTYPLLRRALIDGKTLAVPRCEEKGIMEFFAIASLDELEKGAYGICEPKKGCQKADGFSESSLCIVPAFSFDKNGHRLGYGGGYYDRFLSRFNGIACGICFDEFLSDLLPTDRYDQKADMLITQSRSFVF